MIGSTPTFSEFDPRKIPMQAQVIRDISRFDYSLGTHEVLLSGSVGSAKSILLAHIAIRHAIENSHAGVMIGRRALPDLKATLYKKILEHLGSIDRRYFTAYDSTGQINFTNGSSILSRSWADKHYTKLRSLELSLAIYEELTENKGDDEQGYHEGKMRVGRLPHIKTPLIISATNPDSPSHWAYKYFIEPNSNGNKHPTRHVYYSRTEDNPFLPKSYIEQLKKDLDPKMARRMLYGEWIEITTEVIYYAYNSSKQYNQKEFVPKPDTPIALCFDFNIGDGKPMSAVAACFERNKYHVFQEFIVEGARTEEIMEEMSSRGLLRKDRTYEIYGDASGKARHTASKKSDYEIIKEFLDRLGINYVYKVPLSNPPIRERHNLVNALCENTLGQTRLYLHRTKVLDEGLRLTAFKKGGKIIEDDSKYFQHCTTALGYYLVRHRQDQDRGKSYSIIL